MAKKSEARGRANGRRLRFVVKRKVSLMISARDATVLDDQRLHFCRSYNLPISTDRNSPIFARSA